jgi:hypothetical protein
VEYVTVTGAAADADALVANGKTTLSTMRTPKRPGSSLAFVPTARHIPPAPAKRPCPIHDPNMYLHRLLFSPHRKLPGRGPRRESPPSVVHSQVDRDDLSIDGDQSPGMIFDLPTSAPVAGSTHARVYRLSIRLFLVALASLAILALSAGHAAADGDPASDVLLAQSMFLPPDAPVPSTQAAELQQLINQAARADYPIRVAVIATAADLGSVTALWSKPQSYAEFLAQELSLVYRGPLLIVMPIGLGFSGAHAQRVPADLRTLIPGTALGTAAITAVRELAGASGHPLRGPTAKASQTSTGHTVENFVFLVGLAACIVWFLLVAVDRPRRMWRGSGQTG